jgi:hypothetical protein
MYNGDYSPEQNIMHRLMWTEMFCVVKVFASMNDICSQIEHNYVSTSKHKKVGMNKIACLLPFTEISAIIQSSFSIQIVDPFYS